jgi:hypothetical protein
MNHWRFEGGNGCPSCADIKHMRAEIAQLSADHKHTEERLDRLLAIIEWCEARAEALGLYDAKKRE